LKVLIFDTETTGLKGYTVEIAAVLLNVEFKKKTVTVEKAVATAVNPLVPVEEKVIEMFGITPDRLSSFPSFSTLWKERLEELFRGATLYVAHNFPFDAGVMERELRRLGRKIAYNRNRHKFFSVFCTYLDGKRFMPKLKSYKLESVSRFFKVDEEKVREFYERFTAKTGYSPSQIRAKELTFHNALYDVSVLTYLFLKFLRNYNVRLFIFSRTKGEKPF